MTAKGKARQRDQATGLTYMQKAFAQHVAAGKTNREAYKLAGYSMRGTQATIDRRATETAKKQQVAEYIESLHAKIREKAERSTIASATEVLELLTSMARGELPDHVLNSKGELIEVPARLRDRKAALELLGKKDALFVEKKQVDANITASPILESIMDQLKEDDNT